MVDSVEVKWAFDVEAGQLFNSKMTFEPNKNSVANPVTRFTF